MNIGDYIRTFNGEIGKIVSEGIIHYKNHRDDYGSLKNINKAKIIMKSSSNIIDLIEVGDYVNGYLVTDISLDSYNNKIIFVGQRKIEESGYYKSYYNNQIKSVVTKEQFEEVQTYLIESEVNYIYEIKN